MATMLTTLETFRSKDMQKAYQVLKDYGCRVQFFGSEESGSLSVCDLHHSDFMISVDRVVPESKQSFLVWSPSPFVTYKVLRDAKGNEVRDKFGRYQYEVQRDADGNPMKDKYGHPVYVPEPMVTRSNDDMLRLALSDIVKTSRQYANIDSMVKFHSDYLRTYEWHEMSSQEIKDYKSKLLSVKKRLNSLVDDLGIAVPVAKKETADDLLRHLIALEDPAMKNVVYVLAVMLERSKILIERDAREQEDHTILRVYEHRRTGESFVVLDPRLRLENLAEVQQQVVALLSGTKTLGEVSAAEEQATT